MHNEVSFRGLFTSGLSSEVGIMWSCAAQEVWPAAGNFLCGWTGRT